MRKPDRIVTAAAVMVGVGLVAWWIGRDGGVVPDGALGVTPAGAAARDADAAGRRTQEALAEGTQEAAAERTAGDTAVAARPGEAGAPTGQPDRLTAERAITDHETATRGPRQPIPFSHKFHVRELAIDCAYCHAGTERSYMGVVPPLEVCMGCHHVAGTGLDPIEELRGYWSRNEQVPWEWVNKLPDFVQFSHRAHLRNEVACERCHGPVEEMDRVYQWAPLTMGWCLECHRGQPEATDVATDYRLVRAAPPPQPPGQRQEGSLYPTAIDQRYGAFRAPIDCLTCHY